MEALYATLFWLNGTSDGTSGGSKSGTRSRNCLRNLRSSAGEKQAFKFQPAHNLDESDSFNFPEGILGIFGGEQRV